jgi:4,5-DOPA dioxygenase extradiol
VLVIGSGGFVHNLHELYPPAAAAPTWAKEFAEWMNARVSAGEREDLLDYRRGAPQAARAHPTEEHLLPLFAAMAAGGAAERLHEGFSYGSLAMTAYGFA